MSIIYCNSANLENELSLHINNTDD